MFQHVSVYINRHQGALSLCFGEPLVHLYCLYHHYRLFYFYFAVNADDFNWRLACVCIEDQQEFWNKKDVKMKAILRKDIHYAAVDGVHLMNVSISLSIGKIFILFSFVFSYVVLYLDIKNVWQTGRKIQIDVLNMLKLK